MKNVYARLASFLVIFLVATSSAFASHISGGDFSVTCLGNGQYLVNLNLYRDCDGITMNNSEQLSINSSCGTQTVTANLLNLGGTEISQLCPSVIDSSTCAGGGLPGMELYIYQAVVTLPPCADWVISWNTCCRNTTVNVPTSSGDDMTLLTTLDNATDTCNSSPIFTAQPIPYVCLGQSVTYNYGVYEPDGDSISYALIPGLNDDPNTNLVYTAPYSASNPIDGVTLNQQSGEITFTPTTIGNFIVALQVTEYDPVTGVVLGTVTRDIQFVVENCVNQVPNPDEGVITNLTGNSNLVDSMTIEMCDGGDFTFNISISDPDTFDTVTLTSNIVDAMPGATFTQTSGNPATATISWNAPGGTNFFNTFVVFAEDDACPVTGLQAYVYTIQVLESTVAGPDVIICGDQTAPVSVEGGNAFTWSVLSGDSLLLDSNFFCLDADTICSQGIADPNITTTYLVTSDLVSANCQTQDTVTVTVVPDFTWTVTPYDSAICLFEEVHFDVSVDSAGVYDILWNPGANLIDSATLFDPTIQYIIPDTQYVPFTISSSLGCIKSDTLPVVVSEGAVPDVVLTADTTLCIGDSVQIELTNLNTVVGDCDQYSYTSIPFSPISGSGTTVSLGDDQLSSAIPLGFSFDFWCNTYDEIYISSNGFLTFNSGSGSGCCTGELLPDATVPNDVIAFAWEDLNPNSGGTIEYFTVGSPGSQIFVVNFNNVQHFGGGNAVTSQVLLYEETFTIEIHTTNMPSDGGLHTMGIENSDGTMALAATGRNQTNWSATNDGARFALPQVQQQLNYTWMPSATVSDDTIPEPFVFPTTTTTYTVAVVDSLGGCADTASINIHVVPNFGWTVTQSDTSVCLFEEVTFNVTPDTSGAFTFAYQWDTLPNIPDFDTVANPQITMMTPGSQVIYFEMFAPWGCERSDSVVVDVSTGPIPVASILADTTICIGDSAQLTAFNSNAGTAFADDFDGGFQASWGTTSGVTVGATCTALPPSTDALVFDGATPRVAATPNLVVPSGGTISFWIIQGTGGACELPDANEGITLQYSLDGTTWIDINNYNPGAFTTWTFISEAIPSGAFSPSTQFRWVQSASSGANFDMWAIDDVQITPIGGDYQFTWFPSTGLTDTTIINPLFTLTTDMSYSVIITDTVGDCSDTASIALQVVPNFTWAVAQSDTGICLNDTVNFQVTPSPAGVYTYKWYDEQGFLGADTLDNNTTGTFLTAGMHTLYFDATSDQGCTNDDSVMVNVSPGLVPNPVINSDSVLCVGDSTKLQVAFNTPPMSCDFTFNLNDAGGNGWGGASLSITVNGFLFTTATVTGASNSFSLTFNQGDVVELEYFPSTNGTNAQNSFNFIGPFGDVIFASGTNPSSGILFDDDVSCYSTENYVYDWTPGTFLSDSTIRSPWTTPTQDVSYTVFVMDSVGGCTGSRTINITVVPDFDPTVTQSDTAVCLLESVTFNVNDNAPGTSTYDWTNSNNDDDLLNFDDIANPTAAFTQPGTIEFYVATTNQGCVRIDTVEVEVSPGPIPDITIVPDSNSFCVGGSTQLHVENNPPALGCEYTLEMYDTFGNGWNGASVELEVNGVVVDTYTISSSTASQAVETFTLQHGDQACLNYDSGTFPGEESYSLFDPFGNLLFNDGPLPQNGNGVFCWTSDCGLDISNYSYTWIAGQSSLSQVNISDPIATPALPTTYTVLVVDLIGGCSDQADILIDINLPPTASIDAAGPFCENDNTVTLSTTTPGGTWSGNGITDGNTGAFDPAQANNGPNTITYSLGNAGCVGTATITVEVNDQPPAPIPAANPFYCDGDALVNLSAQGAGTFAWYDGASLVSSDQQPSADDLPLADVAGTQFDVTQTVNGCESDPATLVINVVEMPVAQILCDVDSGLAPLPVNFTNGSTPVAGTSIFWDFGDPAVLTDTSTAQATSYTYGDFATYQVMLAVVSDVYPVCADTAWKDIVVSGQATLMYIPNVFTPNGDGQNDKFMLQHINLVDYQVSIFDRWGRKVGTLTDENPEWDGGNHKDGTYFWVIDYAEGVDGSQLEDLLQSVDSDAPEALRNGSGNVTMLQSGN